MKKPAKPAGRKPPKRAPIDPVTQFSPDQAFQFLFRHCGGAGHSAREQLDGALRLGSGAPGGVRLWVGDTIVDPNWYAEHIRVATRIAQDGKWSAELKPSGLRPVQPGQYQWSVSAKDVAALMAAKPAANHKPEPSTRAKRRPKPYDWELYKAKFYLMLYDDDVSAHANINVQHYASQLMTWGRKNLGGKETPKQAAMREKVAEWKPLWQRLKGASK
jgi:hypothetical protein